MKYSTKTVSRENQYSDFDLISAIEAALRQAAQEGKEYVDMKKISRIGKKSIYLLIFKEA